MEQGLEINSDLRKYIGVTVLLIFYDDIFYFGSRFNMYMTMYTSRKLFFVSSMIWILINSTAVAFIGTIFVAIEAWICKMRDSELLLIILGERISSHLGISYFKLFLTIFAVAASMSFISFLFGAIERLPFVMLIIATILGKIVTEVFLPRGMKPRGDVNMLGISAVVMLVNFWITWIIIRRKSVTGQSWSLRFSQKFNPTAAK